MSNAEYSNVGSNMSCLPRLADRRSRAAVDKVVTDQSFVQTAAADELSRCGSTRIRR
jgi:hypothetical protein